jgi:hypothetical protein
LGTEKFLGIAPSRAEAEHFALYQFYASALTESFKVACTFPGALLRWMNGGSRLATPLG